MYSDIIVNNRKSHFLHTFACRNVKEDIKCICIDIYIFILLRDFVNKTSHYQITSSVVTGCTRV